MRKLRSLSVVLLIFIQAPALLSQSQERPETRALSLFDYFHQQKDSMPLLKLDTDWGKLIRNKSEEEYQEGVLSFRNVDGSLATLDVKLRARGNVRKEVCQYPPIKIKAQKKTIDCAGL